MTPDEIVVTQKDREAAMFIIGYVFEPEKRERILAGKHDDLSIIQLLARHRHEATRALSAQVEELRGMLNEVKANARVGQPGTSPLRSKWATIPSTTYHRICALLAKHKETGA